MAIPYFSIHTDGPILQYCKCAESVQFQLQIITHLLSHSILNSEVYEPEDIKDNIIEHYEEEYLNESEDYDRFERSDSEVDFTPSPTKRKGRKRRSSSSTGMKIKKEKNLTCKNLPLVVVFK